MSAVPQEGRGGAAATLTRPERRRTQRERILLGMTRVASAEGYAEATIAKVIAQAGVSRPTFYEYFPDRDACFLAAQLEIGASALREVRAAVQRAGAGQAPDSALEGLVEFAVREPERARLLLCETLAAGPKALEGRELLIDSIAGIVDGAGAPLPDLPSTLMIGATLWLLSRQLRAGEGDPQILAGELIAWAHSYDRPLAEHRWRARDPSGPAPPAPVLSALPGEPPGTLPPGRPRLSRQEVARNQRERILHATASVAARSGYNATTVAEIIAEAAVDSRVFYAHFADRQQAFMAAHELGFQHTMAVAVGAFFGSASWPQRMWDGILAGTHFQATHPTLSHLLYTQSYAIGRSAVRRIDETHAAFTIFLREGNRLASEPRSECAMEAMVAASFEITFRLSREGRGEQIAQAAPLMTYLCLAPFLGPEATDRFIQARLDAELSARAAGRGRAGGAGGGG